MTSGTYRLSDHAKEEMVRRSIPGPLLESVLDNPQQIVPERESLKAYQSAVDFEGGRRFLLRVIVDDTVEPAVIVTVSRTSKMDKYWRPT